MGRYCSTGWVDGERFFGLYEPWLSNEGTNGFLTGVGSAMPVTALPSVPDNASISASWKVKYVTPKFE
jgi:hypothetical protein